MQDGKGFRPADATTPHIAPAHKLGAHYGAAPVFGGAWTVHRHTWFIDRHGEKDCESEPLPIRFTTKDQADQAALNLNAGLMIDVPLAVAA